MDLTYKDEDEDDAIIGAAAASVLASGVAIIISLDCTLEKDNDNDIEGSSQEKYVIGETSQVKTISRKRNRSSDLQDVIGDISTKIGEVAAAISKIADNRLDVTKLYKEIMKMEGYKEEFLGDAFDYLVQSDTLAKTFMVKNQNLRKVWLDRFKQQQCL